MNKYEIMSFLWCINELDNYIFTPKNDTEDRITGTLESYLDKESVANNGLAYIKKFDKYGTNLYFCTFDSNVIINILNYIHFIRVNKLTWSRVGNCPPNEDVINNILDCTFNGNKKMKQLAIEDLISSLDHSEVRDVTWYIDFLYLLIEYLEEYNPTNSNKKNLEHLLDELVLYCDEF